MNEYIFYTTEGHTIAPNENVKVKNSQVLGFICANNRNEAQDNLLRENPWIGEAGFSKSEFIVRQLLTDEVKEAIRMVLDYLWEDEKKHYEELEEPGNHIFSVLKLLRDSI